MFETGIGIPVTVGYRNTRFSANFMSILICLHEKCSGNRVRELVYYGTINLEMLNLRNKNVRRNDENRRVIYVVATLTLKFTSRIPSRSNTIFLPDIFYSG